MTFWVIVCLQSKHDLKDKNQLLYLVRKFPEGVAVIDRKDSYPTVMEDLQVNAICELSHFVRWTFISWCSCVDHCTRNLSPFCKMRRKRGGGGGGGGLVTHGIFDATQILKGIENQQLEGIFPFPTWFRDLISFLTRSVLLMSLVRIVLYPY